MKTYAAFLLGINVGGRTVKMDRLKKTLESIGFRNVTTLLASGNVVFEASGADPTSLTNKIEKKLATEFGFDIGVIVRSMDDLKHLAKTEPFKAINATSEIRRHVTFLSQPPADKSLYISASGDFKFLRVSDTEVISVLIVTPNSRTVDLMEILRKRFGKRITTRNWNTIEKILNYKL